jgi:ribosome-associated toxin RatA of RatAB toxin-antitoxin module
VAEAQITKVVPCSMEKIYEAILDFESYPRFAAGVKKTKVLGKDEKGIQVQMQVDFMKKIDYSIEVQHELTNQKARVWWHLKEGDFFQKNDGLWELTKVDEESTSVLYRLDVEFSVSVPSFILKGIIKNSLPKAVQDFAAEGKRRG